MRMEYRPTNGAAVLREMQEFAGFPAATQRYIRRSLDIGLERADAVEIWSRDAIETASIRAQAAMYGMLEGLRDLVPETPDYGELMPFYGPLVALSGFDLGQGRLGSFSAYRFLYERLVGARIRPWLPGAFAAAAMLPSLDPAQRKYLLQTIPEAVATAPGWSIREPVFYPEWVEKCEAA